MGPSVLALSFASGKAHKVKTKHTYSQMSLVVFSFSVSHINIQDAVWGFIMLDNYKVDHGFHLWEYAFISELLYKEIVFLY